MMSSSPNSTSYDCASAIVARKKIMISLHTTFFLPTEEKTSHRMRHNFSGELRESTDTEDRTPTSKPFPAAPRQVQIVERFGLHMRCFPWQRRLLFQNLHAREAAHYSPQTKNRVFLPKFAGPQDYVQGPYTVVLGDLRRL